jgi:hypothetical protein
MTVPRGTTPGLYEFKVTVEDSGGEKATRTISLEVTEEPGGDTGGTDDTGSSIPGFGAGLAAAAVTAAAMAVAVLSSRRWGA